VKGFQGANAAAPGRVAACLKHYVGYGAAEGGRDYNTTEISDFTLWNFYLPQFQAGVDAGALTVMSSFNLLSGIPATGNRHTLTDILRGQWHFRGLVVSDYMAVSELQDHGVAATGADAARLALTAGLDMEMISQTYHDTLKQQVRQGTISMKVLDEAVRRVLRVKFEKGLFDQPYTDESLYPTAFLKGDALALSREAAAKSCVLLKNDHQALPLAPDAGKIALIGPLADNAQELVGPWHSRAHTNELVSLAAALRAQAGPQTEITVARGCALYEPGVFKVPRDITVFQPLESGPTGSNEIADAVALAKASDVVVLALGEPLDWSGEDGSRSELNLPGLQQPLFDAVAATGKPVVVVLFNGRPLAISELQRHATAILEAWFPGTAGAQGVADVLLGKADPAGRLTATFPRNLGQVPFYYNHYNTGRPGFGEYKGNYVDVETTPLYPFGFGLAYTTFEFGAAQCAQTLTRAGTLTVRTTVKNTGARAGTAVAELYLRAPAAGAGPRPVRELKGFQKIQLRPGEARAVSFELPASELGYYDAQGRWLVEPGQYRVWISPDSAAGEPATFELTK
jgi:beta-glucosidase